MDENMSAADMQGNTAAYTAGDANENITADNREASGRNKQLFFIKLAGISMVVIAAAIVISLMVLVPKAVATMNKANLLMGQAEEIMTKAETSLDDIDTMTGEITEAAQGINTLVDENAQALKDSMERIGSIDFEGLNSAIEDLHAVVEPLARLFGR